MLKNLWYVVSPSSQLTNDLKAVRIVGQSFVAFRENMVKRVCFLTCACIEGGRSPLAKRLEGAFSVLIIDCVLVLMACAPTYPLSQI